MCDYQNIIILVFQVQTNISQSKNSENQDIELQNHYTV